MELQGGLIHIIGDHNSVLSLPLVLFGKASVYEDKVELRHLFQLDLIIESPLDSQEGQLPFLLN